MGSPAQAFKARARKEVQLPSGLSVTIRRVSLWDIQELGEFPTPHSSSEGQTETQRIDAAQQSLIMQYSGQLIAKSAMNPRFTTDAALENHDEYVHVDDLSMDDRTILTNEIIEFMNMGVTAESATSFRENPERPDSPDHGGAVPQAAH